MQTISPRQSVAIANFPTNFIKISLNLLNLDPIAWNFDKIFGNWWGNWPQNAKRLWVGFLALPYAQILATVLYCFLSKSFRISVDHSTKFNNIVCFMVKLYFIETFFFIKMQKIWTESSAVNFSKAKKWEIWRANRDSRVYVCKRDVRVLKRGHVWQLTTLNKITRLFLWHSFLAEFRGIL